jgi:hypothetical protein
MHMGEKYLWSLCFPIFAVVTEVIFVLQVAKTWDHFYTH